MPLKFLDEQNQSIWIEIRSRRVYRLIMEVWEKMPADAKTLALHRINKISDTRPRVDPIGAMGLSVPMSWGSEIYLPSQDLRKPSDDWVKFLVAHEIAHGILHNPNFCEVPEREQEREQQADETAAAWGFSIPNAKEHPFH